MCVFRAYHVVVILCCIQCTASNRRITNGQDVTTDMPFVVYFLKAAPVEWKYKGWTCSGAIVSPDYIITSAACVEDVEHMYAIAGYKKFVESEFINMNLCTRNRKKKVVFTSVPKVYDLEFQNIAVWAYSDIAVAKVESPYDFSDMSYKKDCSYIPAPIRVSFEAKYQKAGVEAIALGWGHKEKMRNWMDFKSYNSKNLQYTSTTILNKAECKRYYQMDHNAEQLLRLIDKYMICTLFPGNLDEKGELVKPSKPNIEGCDSYAKHCTSNHSHEILGKQSKEETQSWELIEEILEEYFLLHDDSTSESEEQQIENAESKEKLNRKANSEGFPVENQTERAIVSEHENDAKDMAKLQEEIFNQDKFNRRFIKKHESLLHKRSNISSTLRFKENRRRFRRNGICQNDHGGPLVTWVGSHMVLIGIASVFRIDDNFKCVGPYLFTSTQCNGKFLDCILQKVIPKGRDEKMRRSCNANPEQKGYYVVERRISWMYHPDGPAQNEIIEKRPQLPLFR